MDPTAVLDTTLDTRIAQYRAELGIAAMVQVSLPSPVAIKPLANIRRLALGSTSVIALAILDIGLEPDDMRLARAKGEEKEAMIARLVAQKKFSGERISA